MNDSVWFALDLRLFNAIDDSDWFLLDLRDFRDAGDSAWFVLDLRDEELLLSFADWIANLPVGQRPPADSRGPHDSPAGDGIPNLLKFALGLDPMKPSRDQLPKLVLIRTGTEVSHLGLVLTRATNADVTFSLERSDDLQDWLPVSYTIEVVDTLATHRDRIQIMDDSPVVDTERYFLRLRVSRKDH